MSASVCHEEDLDTILDGLANCVLSSSTSAIRSKTSIMNSTEQLQKTLKSVSELSLKPRIRFYAGGNGAISPSDGSTSSKIYVNKTVPSNELRIDDSIIGTKRSRIVKNQKEESGEGEQENKTNRVRSPRRDFFKRESAIDISDSFEKSRFDPDERSAFKHKELAEKRYTVYFFSQTAFFLI